MNILFLNRQAQRGKYPRENLFLQLHNPAVSRLACHPISHHPPYRALASQFVSHKARGIGLWHAINIGRRRPERRGLLKLSSLVCLNLVTIFVAR